MFPTGMFLTLKASTISHKNIESICPSQLLSYRPVYSNVSLAFAPDLRKSNATCKKKKKERKKEITSKNKPMLLPTFPCQ